MTCALRFLVILLVFTLVSCHFKYRRPNWDREFRLKESCRDRNNVEERLAVSQCWFFEGMKSWFRRTSISWFPGKTKSWNLTEVTKHCDDYYVCMENTKCYKDYVLFETLDRCSHDAFSIGPMSFCNQKLKDFHKSSPGNLPTCVLDYLEKDAPKKWTCENTKSLGDCLLPQVQKHCDPGLLSIFHEHQAARQYYLGCDGKLEFQDLEVSNSTVSEEIQIPK